MSSQAEIPSLRFLLSKSLNYFSKMSSVPAQAPYRICCRWRTSVHLPEHPIVTCTSRTPEASTMKKPSCPGQAMCEQSNQDSLQGFPGQREGNSDIKRCIVLECFCVFHTLCEQILKGSPSWCWSTWTSTKTQLRVRSLIASVHHGLMALCSGTWKAYYLFMKGHVYRLVNNADKFHLITTINFSSASCINS